MITKSELAVRAALKLAALQSKPALKLSALQSKLLTFQMKQAHTMHLLMTSEHELNGLAQDHLNPDGGEYAPHTIRDHSKQMEQLDRSIKSYRLDMKLIMQNAEGVQRQIDEIVDSATSHIAA